MSTLPASASAGQIPPHHFLYLVTDGTEALESQTPRSATQYVRRITARRSEPGSNDIFVATRAMIGDSFGEYGNLVNLDRFSLGRPINTSGREFGVSLSSDWPAEGSKLFFATSGRGGLTIDLWEATWHRDCNGDGVVASGECQQPSSASFRRGEINGEGLVDFSDAIALFDFLFLGTPLRLDCEDAADTDDSGVLDFSDGIDLLSYLFLGDAAPAAPGVEVCGYDPTPDPLGCAEFAGCP